MMAYPGAGVENEKERRTGFLAGAPSVKPDIGCEPGYLSFGECWLSTRIMIAALPGMLA